MRRGDPDSPPQQGDRFRAHLVISVGRSNGDFRAIVVEDHLGRPIAHGDVPYKALEQIEATALNQERR